jgi:uncharacterized membrane protein YvlD (DUF360 family)
VLRVAVVWLFTAAVFVLLGWLLPGLTVTSAGAALTAAGLLGLINALVWPVFAYFALPLAVLTLGIAAIVLNGAAVAIVHTSCRALRCVTCGPRSVSRWCSPWPTPC